VLIGRANAKDIPKEELMEHVSFVFQNAKLVKGTILYNVRMGKTCGFGAGSVTCP